MSECLLHAFFTSRIRVHPEANWACNIERTFVNKNSGWILECCRQEKKEAMTFIDIRYKLIELKHFYRIDHNFSYFPANTSHVL